VVSSDMIGRAKVVRLTVRQIERHARDVWKIGTRVTGSREVDSKARQLPLPRQNISH